MTTRRITSIAIACAVAMLVLALVALASLAFGSREIAPDVVWDALVHGGVSQDAQVVTQLRVPRTLAALVIGGALGLAGSIMQAMTRNPLGCERRRDAHGNAGRLAHRRGCCCWTRLRYVG